MERGFKCLVDMETDWRPAEGGAESLIVSERDLEAISTVLIPIIGLEPEYESISRSSACGQTEREIELASSRIRGSTIGDDENVTRITLSEDDLEILDDFLKLEYAARGGQLGR